VALMALIVVVHDDEVMRGVICRTLAASGHTIRGVRDGASALHVCAQKNGAVELMLADSNLADMSPRELIHLAKTDWPDLKLVLLGGSAEWSAPAELLPKPLVVSTLAEEVRRRLGTG
jgi:CheY-like chemotaxis protein